MVKILQELYGLNLSRREIEVISCLYEGHTLNAKQIAKQIGLSEQKAYPYLKSLVNKGFLTSEDTHPMKYRIGHSRAFKHELDKQRLKSEQTEEFLKQLAEKQKRYEGYENPFYQIATAREDNLKLQLNAFNLARKEFLQILNIYHDPKQNRLQKLEFEKTILKMLDRGVSFKTIYPTKAALPKILKENIDRFELRRLDTDFQRCDIIDERFVLLKITDKDKVNFIGSILVDDKNLTKNLKSRFLGLWDEANKH